MMSSIADGSTPDRRTTSGSTAVMSVSGGVLTSVPLKERPIAVRTAPTITGVAMGNLELSVGGSAHIVPSTVFTIVLSYVTHASFDQRHRTSHTRKHPRSPKRAGPGITGTATSHHGKPGEAE